MLVRSRFVATAALMVACVGTCAAANTPDDCKKMRLHGQRAQANACFETLTNSKDAYQRAEGFWGLEQYADANTAFRDAAAANDKDANIRVEWGMLFRQRFNNKDAADLFHEALQRDPKNARAYLGEAYISFDGQDNSAAKKELSQALEIDPKLYEAHELLATIALEDSDNETALAEADKAIAISSDALHAYAVHAAAEVVADRSPDAWTAKITAINPGYGQGYALIAHDLELHYRYEDAIAYYRKAIDADPKLWSARSSLGVNLMRIGQEDEAATQLAMSYNNGETDAMTSNTLKLLDSNKAFVTYKDATTVLKFRKKEADLLQPYFDAELHRILTTYDQKYKMKLPGPVQVEVYPDHEDFAVRTMGMPGLGALGVTFGEAVAMDSPSGRKPGDFNWGATLWHEMSHVYILTVTNHRVPRWFTEGLAVHEEGERDKEWANRVTPEILMAIRDHKLLPVAKLDRGFTSPEYSSQVIVSYFQAGSICDFIAQKWSNDKLLGMVHSYTLKKSTSEAIQENLGISADEFDKQFLASIEKSYGAEAHDFDLWRGLLKGLADSAGQSEWDLVLQQAPVVIKMYPEYVEGANGYEFLAAAQSAKGDKKAAAATLMAYVNAGGGDPVLLKKLASLEVDLGDKKTAADVLARTNYIYPLDEDVHRQLGTLWFDQKNFDGAVREYGAVVALNPLDKAGAQYNLARAENAAGHKDKAEAAVLNALEAAPGYRPAQALLLEIDGGGASSSSTLAAAQPPANPGPSGLDLKLVAAEANAFNSAIAMTDPKAQAAALNAFLTQYPNTQVRALVLEQLLQANMQGDPSQILPTADKLLQVDPNNIRALTMEVYAHNLNSANITDAAQKQAELDQAASFAQKGLVALNNPPKGMDPPTVAQMKASATPVLYGAIGAAALNKKDAPAAIDAYKKELASVPEPQTTRDVQLIGDTYQLAQAYMLSAVTTPTDYVNCAFYAARASAYALDQFKTPMLKTAQYCYTKYHGRPQGFEAVQQAAATRLNFSPAIVEPAGKPEDLVTEVLQGTDPCVLALADREFILQYGTHVDANSVKDADKVWACMKGKSVTIPDALVMAAMPTQLQVAVSDDAQETKTADITVTIKPMGALPAVGSKITFQATYDSYTQSPFMITMTGGEVQLPKPAAPATRTRPTR